MTFASPAFAPGVVVILEPPHGQAGTRTLAERAQRLFVERNLTEDLRTARRRMQTHAARQRVLRAMISAIVDASGAADALTAVVRNGTLLCSRSHAGSMHPPKAPNSVLIHLRARVAEDIYWLPTTVRQVLGVHQGHCLALPLRAGGNDLGYLLLAFDEPLALTENASEILLNFAALVASVCTLGQASLVGMTAASSRRRAIGDAVPIGHS